MAQSVSEAKGTWALALSLLIGVGCSSNGNSSGRDSASGEVYANVGNGSVVLKQVASGQFFSCGLKADDTILCWGLINGAQALPPPGTFAKIAAGWYHACGLATDGSIACWGNNYQGSARGSAGALHRRDRRLHVRVRSAGERDGRVLG
jgi:alpha-tubulin suppressor-like RCC1 family protein